MCPSSAAFGCKKLRFKFYQAYTIWYMSYGEHTNSILYRSKAVEIVFFLPPPWNESLMGLTQSDYRNNQKCTWEGSFYHDFNICWPQVQFILLKSISISLKEPILKCLLRQVWLVFRICRYPMICCYLFYWMVGSKLWYVGRMSTSYTKVS